jgi:hypothetical protein
MLALLGLAVGQSGAIIKRPNATSRQAMVDFDIVNSVIASGGGGAIGGGMGIVNSEGNNPVVSNSGGVTVVSLNSSSGGAVFIWAAAKPFCWGQGEWS